MNYFLILLTAVFLSQFCFAQESPFTTSFEEKMDHVFINIYTVDHWGLIPEIKKIPTYFDLMHTKNSTDLSEISYLNAGNGVLGTSILENSFTLNQISPDHIFTLPMGLLTPTVSIIGLKNLNDPLTINSQTYNRSFLNLNEHQDANRIYNFQQEMVDSFAGIMENFPDTKFILRVTTSLCPGSTPIYSGTPITQLIGIVPKQLDFSNADFINQTITMCSENEKIEFLLDSFQLKGGIHMESSFIMPKNPNIKIHFNAVKKVIFNNHEIRYQQQKEEKENQLPKS